MRGAQEVCLTINVIINVYYCYGVYCHITAMLDNTGTYVTLSWHVRCLVL